MNLSGWDGGVTMAYSDAPEHCLYRHRDDAALLADMYFGFCHKYTWPGLTEAEERMLYVPDVYAGISGLAFESLRDEFKHHDRVRRELKGESIYMRNHCGRFTHNMITFYRSHVEMRFPFFDYDLMDFMFSLPPHLLKDRMLYRAVTERVSQRLARIPLDDDESLPTTQPLLSGAQKLWLKARHRLSACIPALVPPHPTLYADYENYLRHELRAWAEDIMYDPRTEARGIFDPTFVRSLMERHMSGQELYTIGKVAPLITLEMMMRRFFDEA